MSAIEPGPDLDGIALVDHGDDVGGGQLAHDPRRHAGARRRRGDDGAGGRLPSAARSDGAGRRRCRRRRCWGYAGHLVGAGPVLGPPLLERLGRVVGVDLHEPVRGEQLGADVVPFLVERLEVYAAEGRQEHGEVERQRVGGAVQLLVVDDALLDAGHVRPGDGPDAPLAEEGLGPQLRGGLESLLGERQPTDAEVAQLVLVGQVDDVGQVAHPGLAYLVLDVEGVLEGCALARARPVAHADDQGLVLALLHLGDRCLQRGRRLGGMARGAHREGVAIRDPGPGWPRS